MVLDAQYQHRFDHLEIAREIKVLVQEQVEVPDAQQLLCTRSAGQVDGKPVLDDGHNGVHLANWESNQVTLLM